MGGEPAERLHQLGCDVVAPAGLRDLGIVECSIEAAFQQALANPYWNPAPLEADGLRSLLAPTSAGVPPSA